MMIKNNYSDAIKKAAAGSLAGLFITLIIFFSVKGKGLQLLMPGILFIVFFAVAIIAEKIKFFRNNLWAEIIFIIITVIIAIILI